MERKGRHIDIHSFPFQLLRRFPDVEAPNLFASDATDALILDEAANALRDVAPGGLAVIEDRYGALTLGAAAIYKATRIRVFQDSLSGELALRANSDALRDVLAAGAATSDARIFTHHTLGQGLLAGATAVLLQLPRELAALDEIAESIARYAPASVQVFAGGRLKHMAPAHTTVLRSYFGEVHGSLARQKSRVLHASNPKSDVADSRYPLKQFHADVGIWVCAYGAAFGGTKLDIGTRFLLGYLDRMLPEATTAIDLGCGTGVLATALAMRRPGLRVIATDQSTSAVASAVATADANGEAEQVNVVRDDAMTSFADASADLVVCNPPFHIGASVHTGSAHRLFEAAARVLRPGGELWTVFNSHLAYPPILSGEIGSTRVVGRNAKFTVTVSVRRAD